MLNLRCCVNDIADAASCVHHLAEEGLIDPKKVGVTGHLAGGYATMQAFGKFRDTWAAGIVESGTSNMQAMFDESHKFKFQYLQPLCFKIGTPLADRKCIIDERNPMRWIQNID